MTVPTGSVVMCFPFLSLSLSPLLFSSSHLSFSFLFLPIHGTLPSRLKRDREEVHRCSLRKQRLGKKQGKTKNDFSTSLPRVARKTVKTYRISYISTYFRESCRGKRRQTTSSVVPFVVSFFIVHRLYEREPDAFVYSLFLPFIRCRHGGQDEKVRHLTRRCMHPRISKFLSECCDLTCRKFNSRTRSRISR